jgi:hypothetical protein
MVRAVDDHAPDDELARPRIEDVDEERLRLDPLIVGLCLVDSRQCVDERVPGTGNEMPLRLEGAIHMQTELVLGQVLLFGAVVRLEPRVLKLWLDLSAPDHLGITAVANEVPATGERPVLKILAYPARAGDLGLFGVLLNESRHQMLSWSGDDSNSPSASTASSSMSMV